MPGDKAIPGGAYTHPKADRKTIREPKKRLIWAAGPVFRAACRERIMRMEEKNHGT